MSWKQKWPQNHKTSKFRMSSLESCGLKFHWLLCTRYQVDTVSLNHWRKPVLMSLTVTHIFITLQNLKAKCTTIVTTQVLGPMLGHVILQNAFFPPPYVSHGAKGSKWICFVWIGPWLCITYAWVPEVHPRNLTCWTQKMEVWKMIFLFKVWFSKVPMLLFRGVLQNGVLTHFY